MRSLSSVTILGESIKEFVSEVVWLVHPPVGQGGQVGAGGHVDWVAVV